MVASIILISKKISDKMGNKKAYKPLHPPINHHPSFSSSMSFYPYCQTVLSAKMHSCIRNQEAIDSKRSLDISISQ